MLIAFAVCAVIIITPYISKFLLQEEFYSAWTYSPVLIVASGLGCISAFFGAFFGAFYKPHLGTITTLIGAVINIGLSFSLVPFIGVYGAIIANTCSYIAIVISRILYCKKLVKLEVGHLKTAISFVLLLLQAVVYTFNFPLKIISGAVVLVLIALLYFRDIKGLVKVVLSMLKGKKIKAQANDESVAMGAEEDKKAQTLDKTEQ